MRRTNMRVGIAAAAVIATVALSARRNSPRSSGRKFNESTSRRQDARPSWWSPIFRRARSSGRHTHPGEEVAYVLEGAIVLDVAGKTPVTLKSGQGFMIPAGVPHSATNKSPAPARVLANYIIEKGKPIATPAP